MRDAEKARAHAMVCQDDRSSETWKIASMAHQMSHAAGELHVKRPQLARANERVSGGTYSRLVSPSPSTPRLRRAAARLRG